MAEGIDRQRLLQEQAPAGDVAGRVAHQARSVLLVDQQLIAVHLAVGVEGADKGEQALAGNAAHRCELAGARHHHAQRIAALDAELPRQLFADDDVVLARLQLLLLDVDQIRGQRIGFVGIDAEHHPDRHAAGALQHHVTGGQRCDARDALQLLHLGGRQLLRVDRSLRTGNQRLRHQAEDVVLQILFETVHHRQHGDQRHHPQRNADGGKPGNKPPEAV